MAYGEIKADAVRTSGGSTLNLTNLMEKSGGDFTGDVTLGTDKIDLNATTGAATFAGSVGIGTASIDASLHVKGADTHGVFVLEAGGASGNNNQIYIQAHNNAGTSLGEVHFQETAADQGDLVFKTNGGSVAERMRVDSSGRVGIGTSSPTSLLDVQSSTAGVTINAASTATSGESALFITGKNSSGVSRTGVFKYDSSDLFRIGTAQAVDIRFETSDAERMRLNSLGNVGIGNSNPSHRLSIAGSADNKNSEITITATGVASAYIGANANGLNLGTDTEGIVFKTGVTGGGSVGATGTERMKIDSSGHVGIDTTNPANALVVSKGGGEGFEVDPGSVANNNILLHYNRSSSVYVTAEHRAAAHVFDIGASEAARIDSSGRLLVGTNSATPGTTAATSIVGSALTQSTGLQSVASNGTLDLEMLGGAFVGHLYVTQVYPLNATVRTSGIYFVTSRLGNGTVITALNSANGTGGAYGFTITNPSGNIMRFTNTQAATGSVSMSFVGTTGF